MIANARTAPNRQATASVSQFIARRTRAVRLAVLDTKDKRIHADTATELGNDVIIGQILQWLRFLPATEFDSPRSVSLGMRSHTWRLGLRP